MAAPGAGCPAWARPRLLPAAPHPTRETPLALGDTCLQALLPPTLTLFPCPPSPAQAFCAQGLDRARRRRGRSLPEPWVQPVWSPPRRPLPPQPSPALHTPGGWRPEGPAPGQSRVGQHLGPGGGGWRGVSPRCRQETKAVLTASTAAAFRPPTGRSPNPATSPVPTF